jgi:uncharacterized protein
MWTLLKGTVGSTAYGLNGPNSDIDSLGMFKYDTGTYIGLKEYQESIVTKDPDTTMHEARKYCRLALKCNPTVTELLWLPEYTYLSDDGLKLIDLREDFLSEKYVREAYLGYAKSQLTRLQDRDHKRAAKHAMHMARLVNQGAELYTSGKVTIRVSDPEWYFDFKTRGPEYWLSWYNTAEKIFRESKCVLPEHPRTDRIDDWLYTTIVKD